MTDNPFLVPQTKSESMPPKKLPCPFSAAGMLQPSHLQAPPMFGPRGSTIPPKHLAPYAHFKINRSQPRSQPAANNRNFNHQFRPKGAVPRYRGNVDNNSQTKGPQRHQQRSREFWCEPCDRDFNSQDLLQEHNSQHQKCGIDGCKFVGHELIVSKHIQMQHSTGLYDRLKNLETPEDISKWREERKKRYPTKANIELRQQMHEERNKRGETLTNSKARFGRNSDRRRCNNNSTDGNRASEGNRDGKPDKHKDGKRKRRRPNKKIVASVEQPDDEKDAKESANATINALPMFRGTSQLKNYKRRKEVRPTNALSSLLGAYESDDSNASETFSDDTESCDEMESETTIPKLAAMSDINSSKETCSTIVRDGSNIADDTSVRVNDPDDSPIIIEESINKPNKVCETETSENSAEKVLVDNDMDDSELPSEEPITKMEIVDSSPTFESAPKVTRSRKAKTMVLDKRLSKKPTIMDLSKKYRNQNTMLEKLLQNDIRHERNVLLQCVRHVVRGNFFGIGHKPS